MPRSVRYAAIIVCLIAIFYLGGFQAFQGQQVAQAQALAAQFNGRSKADDDGVVTALTLRGKEFSDADLERLLDFPHLTSLDLASTAITDSSLDQIAKLSRLTTLTLDGTHITDKGLAKLQPLPLKRLSLQAASPGVLTADGLGKLKSLTSLNLSGSEVFDDSAEAFASLNQLQNLYVARTRMTSACLPALSQLKNLELLNLAELSLNSVEDTASISGMTSLQLLYLDNAQFDDQSMAALAAACGAQGAPLQSLFLEGCQVTDASREALKLLVSRPEFMKLRLTGTQVSRSVFDEIRASAPDVSYSHGNGGEVD